MPAAMAALALVFLGNHAADSYAAGAILGGSYALGEAAFAPWRGRVLDRGPGAGVHRELSVALLGSAAVLFALALLGQARAPLNLLVAFAVAAAALPAGVPGGYRALLTEILDEETLLVAFSWDAVLLEIEWLIAPALVTAALLTSQPAAPVLAWPCGRCSPPG